MHMAQWLEGDFLSYLKSWEDSVAKRPNFKKAEKNCMLLSDATLEGIRMTGKISACCIMHIICYSFAPMHTNTHTHTRTHTHTHTHIHTHTHTHNILNHFSAFICRTNKDFAGHPWGAVCAIRKVLSRSC